MIILAIVQTPDELRWACARAAKPNQENAIWHILRLGEALNTPLPPVGLAAGCQFISVEDLEIDEERVWKETREMQAELWKNLGEAPHERLYLVIQHSIADFLLRLIYAEAAISIALQYVRPDKVCIPPVWSSTLRKELPLAFQPLQWMVSFVSERQNVRCDRHWSTAIYQNLSGIISGLEQLGRYAAILTNDLFRIICWVAAIIYAYCRRLMRVVSPTADEVTDDSGTGAILIANIDYDLYRQFDLKRLYPRIVERCLFWLIRAKRLGYFNNPKWEQRVLPLYLTGRDKDADTLADQNFISVKRHARTVFPTLMTPLVLRHRKVWYCSAWPAPIPKNVSPRLRPLMGSNGMARERLLNWRRIVFAARFFSLACDLFRALRPALLVAGDTVDTQRAITLAARHSNLRSLATSHGIQMWSENFFDFYPLADLHCVFGASSGLISDKDFPGINTWRVVCHDTFSPARNPRATGKTSRVDQRCRVLIITSLYSTVGWANELFVRHSTYKNSLYTLVEALSTISGVEVTIKSHPTCDQYEIYEEIQRAFPLVVKHCHESWIMGQDISAEAVIFYNSVSTFFFTAAQQNIPIVSHRGALTPLARRVFTLGDLAGSDDSAELGILVKDIISAPYGRAAQDARARAQEVSQKFLRPSVGGLNEALELSMEGLEESPGLLIKRRQRG